jgi:hypothetical protein
MNCLIIINDLKLSRFNQIYYSKESKDYNYCFIYLDFKYGIIIKDNIIEICTNKPYSIIKSFTNINFDYSNIDKCLQRVKNIILLL